MNKYFTERYKISWVLTDELAVGPAPIISEHIDYLKEQGIVSILSLCSKEEAKPPENIENFFKSKRIILPDHKYERKLTLDELQKSIKIIEELKPLGPVLVHCVASVERSPLVCMAWLIVHHNLDVKQALDYLMSIHRQTNPLPSQLMILNDL